MAEFGSKEAYSATISAMYGLPKRANAELEKNGREQLAVQRKIANGIERLDRQPAKEKPREI